MVMLLQKCIQLSILHENVICIIYLNDTFLKENKYFLFAVGRITYFVVSSFILEKLEKVQ